MRFTGIPSFLLLAAGAVHAASSWSFDDGSVSVHSKKSDGDVVKQTFGPQSPLKTPVDLGIHDTIAISFTSKDSGKAKRPHQAFVLLKDQDTGLEAPFPLSVRDTGKGKVQITQRDIPLQFFASSKPIHASVVIGSFGSSQGIVADAFDIKLQQDATKPAPVVPSPLRYGKKPQIHHKFKKPTVYPHAGFSLVFMAVVGAALPALVFIWFFYLGANLSHLPKAMGAAPLSHAVFLGSVVGMEVLYYFYHRGMRLGHILVPAAILGTTITLSGMKALGEVQRRRLAGER